MIEDTVRFDEFGLAISELLGSFAQLPEPLLVSFLSQLFVALLHALLQAVAALWQVALAPLTPLFPYEVAPLHLVASAARHLLLLFRSLLAPLVQ